MPEKSTVNMSIDLSSASTEDLNNIKNEVLARLAQRVGSGALVAAGGYDRHGSGHSRATPPVVQAAGTIGGGT
jgi:hypothetical protein